MCILQLQRQIPVLEDMGDVGGDTKMPHVEPKIGSTGGEQTREVQPETEQPTGEPRTGREGGVQVALMLSGVVTEAPLWIDDSPIPDRLRCGYLPPRTDDRVRYGAGQSYTQRRVKHMARKGIVNYVGNSSDE